MYATAGTCRTAGPEREMTNLKPVSPKRPKHFVLMVKAPTKAKLRDRVAAALDPIESEDIISISYTIDLHFFWPWRRNSAMIVIRPLGD